MPCSSSHHRCVSVWSWVPSRWHLPHSCCVLLLQQKIQPASFWKLIKRWVKIELTRPLAIATMCIALKSTTFFLACNPQLVNVISFSWKPINGPAVCFSSLKCFSHSQDKGLKQHTPADMERDLKLASMGLGKWTMSPTASKHLSGFIARLDARQVKICSMQGEGERHRIQDVSTTLLWKRTSVITMCCRSGKHQRCTCVGDFDQVLRPCSHWHHHSCQSPLFLCMGKNVSANSRSKKVDCWQLSLTGQLSWRLLRQTLPQNQAPPFPF